MTNKMSRYNYEYISWSRRYMFILYVLNQIKIIKVKSTSEVLHIMYMYYFTHPN